MAFSVTQLSRGNRAILSPRTPRARPPPQGLSLPVTKTSQSNPKVPEGCDLIRLIHK